jgi:hypothetical protein
MHDLPTGSQLLALGRAVLLEALMPLLPPERRFDALLVGNCLAIAAREAAAAAGPGHAIDNELRGLYGERSAEPHLFADRASTCDSAPPQVTVRSEARVDEPDLWRRFAQDLRVGAFANSPGREAQARAVLWQLTIAKLRLANPRFLAANGFASGDRPGDRNHVP